MTRVWLIAFLCACSSSPATTRPPPASPAPTSKPEEAAAQMPPAPAVPHTTPPDPRYFSAPEAPDSLSCRDDKDCIADTIVDTQSGCCMQESEPVPQTWAWHAWVAERRMGGNCHEVKCKPVSIPDKLPKACLLEARCASGRCANTCEVSSATPPDAGPGHK